VTRIEKKREKKSDATRGKHARKESHRLKGRANVGGCGPSRVSRRVGATAGLAVGDLLTRPVGDLGDTEALVAHIGAGADREDLQDAEGLQKSREGGYPRSAALFLASLAS
jgi:hypothetical protein